MSLFGVFNTLADWRHRKRVQYEIANTIVTLIAGAIAWHWLNSELSAWNLRERVTPIIAEIVSVLHVIISVLIGLALGFFFRFLPFLYYTPHALAMRTMGLVWASEVPGDIEILLKRFLEFHPRDERIRIICISGRYLFRESRLLGVEPNLKQWAVRGLLDVIMPVTDATNPTIAGRYTTYSQEWLSAAFPNGVQDLLQEIELGKSFLRSCCPHLPGNTVIEHDMLCMWRVIILKKHCLVQNYFPNVLRGDSDAAPILVFENEPGSYYQTFERMFDLVRVSRRG